MENPDNAETQLLSPGPGTPRGKASVAESCEGLKGKKRKAEEAEEEAQKVVDQEVDVLADLTVKGHSDPFIQMEPEEDKEEKQECPEEEEPKEEDEILEEAASATNEQEGLALQDTVCGLPQTFALS